MLYCRLFNWLCEAFIISNRPAQKWHANNIYNDWIQKLKIDLEIAIC